MGHKNLGQDDQDDLNQCPNKRSSIASVTHNTVGRMGRTDAGAGGVAAARSAIQRAGGGAIPTSALQAIRVLPVPMKVAKELIVKHHYLHSLPGGTQLAFGVFLNGRLMGAVTLGVGPFNSHRLVEGAPAKDCLTLSRLWLTDELPKNSESKVIGAVLRSLKKHTDLKFVLSYADPAQGHAGTIYQATNWAFIGLSDAIPYYILPNGKPRHSRSLAHAYGTRSLKHFKRHGVKVKLVPQQPKNRYVFFLDPELRDRLRVPVLPYPKAHQI